MIRLVLASSSPRREVLLRDAGYEFTKHPVDVEEAKVDFLSVGELVLLNAVKKARAAARFHPSAIVIAADTLVALEGQALGKPTDMDEARSMLRRLSGKTHQVFSGVSLVRKIDSRTEFVIEVTNVTFKELSEEQIDAYLNSINPLDKAGGYAAQENGERVIERVEGSWTNVVGLPMERLAQLLQRFLG